MTTENAAAEQAAGKTLEFKRTHVAANRGVTSYQADGADGTFYLSKGAFGGKHPDSFAVTLPAGFEPGEKKAAKPAETPEERKARLAQLRAANAQLTPAQKAEKKREKAAQALARAEAAIKKAQEKAAKGAAAPAEGAAPQTEAPVGEPAADAAPAQ